MPYPLLSSNQRPSCPSLLLPLTRNGASVGANHVVQFVVARLFEILDRCWAMPESKDSFFWEIQAKPSYLYQPVFKWRYWEIRTVAIARICLLLQTYHDLHVAPLTLQYSGDCNRVHFPGDSIKRRRSLASGEKTGPSMFDTVLASEQMFAFPCGRK